MTPAVRLRPRWILASVAFHALICSAMWRVRVPPEVRRAQPLALHLLPTLARPAAAEHRVTDPPLAPGPIARPILRPPPVPLEAARLMPGPFPHTPAAFEALRAQPVVPAPPLPRAAASGAGPIPILPRDPPAPVLE